MEHVHLIRSVFFESTKGNTPHREFGATRTLNMPVPSVGMDILLPGGDEFTVGNIKWDVSANKLMAIEGEELLVIDFDEFYKIRNQLIADGWVCTEIK